MSWRFGRINDALLLVNIWLTLRFQTSPLRVGPAKTHDRCPLRVNQGLAIQPSNRPLSVVVQSRPKWCDAANAVMCHLRHSLHRRNAASYSRPTHRSNLPRYSITSSACSAWSACPLTVIFYVAQQTNDWVLGVDINHCALRATVIAS